MKYRIVPIKNISRLQQAGEALISRGPGMPGMGLIWGATGFGKSTAAAWFVNQCHGVYVRALAVSTPSSLLHDILRELDVEMNGNCAQMVEKVIEKLAQQGRPLFIDEADYLVASKRMTETLRDLHDLSTMPVVLIGMAGIKQKLAARTQLFGRISQWVEFQGADADDARLLASQLCEVEVADDLLEQLHRASEGSVRLIVVGLSHIEHFARSRGLKKVDASKWTGEFLLDQAPSGARRRAPVVAFGAEKR